jgi:hypothetical protein
LEGATWAGEQEGLEFRASLGDEHVMEGFTIAFYDSMDGFAPVPHCIAAIGFIFFTVWSGYEFAL